MRKITHYILYILITYILITCTALLNIQCSGNGKEKTPLPELIHAESVMFEHPDSALHILKAMPMPSARWNKENHALWCLLTSQAKVKLIMKISSDSLVRIAYDYYKSTNNARRKAMSALYMGDINYDLGNIEEAMQYYLEGKTEVEKTVDYKTGYLIMSSLGKLYLYRRLADYSLEACTKAYDYAVMDYNKRYQMGSLQCLARCYCILNELPKAIETYQKCRKIAVELGLENSTYYYNILSEIALVYKNDSQFSESLEILKSFPLKFQSFSLIGKNYFYLKQYDSAYFYLNKALLTDNIYTKTSVYEFLYKLGNQPKYHKYLKSYCDSLLFYNDSIITLDKGKEIIAYKEKYDNEKLTNDKQRLELEKAYVFNWLMIAVVIVLLLIVSFVFFYFHKKMAIHRKEEKIAQLAISLHQMELEVDKNESYIEELQQQYNESSRKEDFYIEQLEALESLKEENKRLCSEKMILQNKLASYYVEEYELSNIKLLSDKLYRLEKRENELCTLLLEQIPLLNKLHSNPIYLKDKELKDIMRITDSIFQDFTHRLLSDVPTLNENELLLCCLIKLRFSISEISLFLNIASTSVSRRKLRVKNKIFSKIPDKTTEKSFDIWLWEY